MKNLIGVLLFIAGLFSANKSISQAGSPTCLNMPGICTNGIYYVDGNGINASQVNPGNDYSCVFTQPSPNWFFMRVTQSGSLDFTISAANDIDFVLWGPFTSQYDIESQCNNYGGIGAPPVVDCSYLTASVEYVNITSALAGEFYVILITNYSMLNQTLTFTQTGGTGSIACNAGSTISGSVYADEAQNCNLDSVDYKMPYTILNVQPYNFYGFTDVNGDYTVPCDTGITTIAQIIPTYLQPLITQLCPVPPAMQQVNVLTDSSIITGIDFANEVIPCPVLEISVVSSIRRLCFPGYTLVEYCNIGFADTNNITVLVDMPDYITVTGSSLPYTIDANGNLNFTIASLVAGECGTITIQDSVQCGITLLGLTQCVTAWTNPGNDCLNNLDPDITTWDQSSVMVTGDCVLDSLACFTIYNTGDAVNGDMDGTSEYRIYENNVLVYTGTFQLAGQDSVIICWPAGGNSIQLQADQRPGHPGNSNPNDYVEACGQNGSGNVVLGQITQAPTDDNDLNVDEDCKIIVASYDPNEKMVSPTGYGSTYMVSPGTELEYEIHFQNTGTDTAFNIMVVDTLSNDLDISTLQLGASSHPYTLEVTGMGRVVLKFKFNDILLPDSTTDLFGSMGVFEYRIAPYNSLSLGTQIHNYADIYFDFNPPVATNDSWVTVDIYSGKPLTVEDKINEQEFVVYPNPTTGFVNVMAVNRQLIIGIEVMDIRGKKIIDQQVNAINQFIDFSGFEQGIYFLKINTVSGSRTMKVIRN